MRRIGVLVSVAALLLAACGKESTPAAAEPQTIEVRAANYTFAAPATLGSGAVEITLSNAGPEPHQAQLFRLNDGVTAKKIIAAAKADASGLGVNKLGIYAGGPNAVDARETQVTTTSLSAGNYVFMCLVPDAKGRAHAGLGMVKAVTVEENADEAAAPSATYTAATKDFGFDLPEAWAGTIAVKNNGQQPHEFQVMEIAKGKTSADFEAFFKAPPGSEPPGPPPWTTGGGSAVIASGQTDTFTADLKPGTYYLMCFVADPVKKAPHFALGMMKKFEVK
jgi:uncharacterized cupredoxin-like copper-binding protein